MDSPTKEEQEILDTLLLDIREASSFQERGISVETYLKFEKNVRTRIRDQMYRQYSKEK